MKKIISFLLILIWSTGQAQLDTEHWFAPVAARAGTANYEGYLYLSTNETTPFTVSVYNNSTVFTTATISKGNPAKVSVPSNYMMGIPQADLFVPTTKGLYLKAPNKFYANFRFSITNHGEIITSKGFAGLGTTFFAAMAPNTAQQTFVSSTISVIATEDNTTVTFSGYNPAVLFSDGSVSASKTVILNKGQSYMMDVVSTDSTVNLTGLIGTKIVANKAISVTNGNFNGIYTLNNFSNNDILMDQSVPVDRLGKDFVVVKGNGDTTSGMESVLVVATENLTQITVNGVPFGAPLNTGQYVLIPGTNYVNQGNSHYNMGVKSDKNIYVYQLLAGTTGASFPAGGFNYIPPLSCYLPNKVDEIGFIDTIGFTSYATKLNILTQAGATVTVNGSALPVANGPYPVTGNPQWVSYSVSNVTGNITVNSTKSVTAGIAAGSGAVGYGGYFAGFSSVPAIVKTGDCYAGIKLQVDNSYDSYQWYLNGVAIAGATTYFINPELYGAGSYTVLITKNNCESKLTEVYNYTLCPPITSSTFTIGSCNTLTVTPAFTNSTQTINVAATKVVGAPTNGTTVVNASGQIIYTPNPGLTADTTDQFIYYIEGNGTPAAFEYFKVIVNIDVLKTTNAALAGCASSNGNGLFDLTSVTLSPDSGTTATYYTDPALTNQITATTAYSSSGGTVYANVTSQYGCSKAAQINLTVNPSPNINTSAYNAVICDDNFDGIINVDFSTVTPQIVNNPASFNVRYYLVQSDAFAGNNSNLPNNWSYSTNTIVYVRVDAISGGCPSVFGQINYQIGTKLALTTSNASASVCDNNLDGSENIVLSNYNNLFTTNTSVTATYYSTLANAQNATNPIAANQILTLAGGSFFIRFESPSTCPNIGQLTLTLNQPSTSSTLTNQTICATSTIQLNAGPGFSAYLWSTGAATQSITVGPGNYFVDLTSANGCVYRQNVTVTGVTPPSLNTSNFNGALCDDNFDGIINVNFSTITPQIVTNSANYNVRYYLNATDANAGNNTNLPNNWNYTATTVVYVRVDALSGNCPPAIGQITFSIGSKIPLLTQNAAAEVCDADLSGSESVNLGSYKTLFTADPAVTLTFYNTLADAQNGTAPISATQVITGTSVFYVRFTSPTQCPNTGKLTLTLKAPKSSALLVDQTICPENKTVLDAGPGFTSYLWSTGATTQSITVGVGNYYVDLGSNGCVYRQNVKVLASQPPVITKIDINGSTATINVSGGTPPYQYSLDGVNYQLSNVFTGLKKGIHTAYVTSAEGCTPVKKDFLILGLLNFITPNGDGLNDILDYSDLKIYENVGIEIYDRYGALIFKSKPNEYIWDGKLNGLPLNTGNYWYKIKWNDPETDENIVYTGWILLKNRN